MSQQLTLHFRHSPPLRVRVDDGEELPGWLKSFTTGEFFSPPGTVVELKLDTSTPKVKSTTWFYASELVRVDSIKGE